MSANIVTTLPLGPLDPERTDLLLRVVDGLEPSTLQWLSGFAAGVAHERARAAAGACRSPGVPPSRRRRARNHRPADHRLRLADRQQQTHRRASRSRRRSGRSRGPCLRFGQLSAEGPGQGADAGRGRQHAGRRRSAGRCAWLHRIPASRRAPKLEQLYFSVLALGDSSYPKFCETGRQVDERLGGTRCEAHCRPCRLRRRLRDPGHAVARSCCHRRA